MKQNPSQIRLKNINCEIPYSYANFKVGPLDQMRKYFDKIQQILPQLRLPILVTAGFKNAGEMLAKNMKARKAGWLYLNYTNVITGNLFSIADVMR